MSFSEITLSKTFEIEGIPALELSVRYDHSTNTVSGIDKILFKVNDTTIDAGGILTHFFEDGVNALIDKTDWRYIYRESINDKRTEAREMNPLAFAS